MLCRYWASVHRRATNSLSAAPAGGGPPAGPGHQPTSSPDSVGRPAAVQSSMPSRYLRTFG
jgi:hypothetical protein